MIVYDVKFRNFMTFKLIKLVLPTKKLKYAKEPEKRSQAVFEQKQRTEGASRNGRYTEQSNSTFKVDLLCEPLILRVHDSAKPRVKPLR